MCVCICTYLISATEKTSSGSTNFQFLSQPPALRTSLRCHQPDPIFNEGVFSKDPGAALTPRHTCASNGSKGSPFQHLFLSPKSQHRALSCQIAHLASAAVDMSGFSSLTSKTCTRKSFRCRAHLPKRWKEMEHSAP